MTFKNILPVLRSLGVVGLALFTSIAFYATTPTLTLESDIASKALQMVSNHKGKLALAGTLLTGWQLYKKYKNSIQPHHITQCKDLLRKSTLNGTITSLYAMKYVLWMLFYAALEKAGLDLTGQDENNDFIIKLILSGFVSSLLSSSIYKKLNCYNQKPDPCAMFYPGRVLIDTQACGENNLLVKSIADTITCGLLNVGVLGKKIYSLYKNYRDALRNNDIENIKFYSSIFGFKENISTSSSSWRGYTPVQFAVLSRDIEPLKFLIENDPEFDINATVHGQNLLQIAVEHAKYIHVEVRDRFKVAKYLIEQGVNTDYIHNNPQYWLNEALRLWDLELLELLIDNGIQVNPNAILNSNVNKGGYLRDNIITVSLIIMSAQRNMPELFRFLLENGADTLIPDSLGNTIYNYIEDKPEIKALLQQYRNNVANKVTETTQEIFQDQDKDLGNGLIPNIANIVSEYIV